MTRTTNFLCPKLAKLNGRESVTEAVSLQPETFVENEEIITNVVGDRLKFSKKRKRDDFSHFGYDDPDITDTDSDPESSKDVSFTTNDDYRTAPSVQPPLLLLLRIPTTTPNEFSKSPDKRRSASRSSSSSSSSQSRISCKQHQHAWKRSARNKIGNSSARVQYRYTCTVDGCFAKRQVRTSEAATSIGQLFDTSSGIMSEVPLIDQYRWRLYGRKQIDGTVRVYYYCTIKGCPAKKYVEDSGNSIGCSKWRFRTLQVGNHEHDHPERLKFSTTYAFHAGLLKHVPETDIFCEQKDLTMSETYDSHDLRLDAFGGSIDYSHLGDALQSPLNINDVTANLKPSKTPCVDSLAFCVVMRLGAYEHSDGSIAIVNFRKVLDGIIQFCTRRSQTADEESRIKTLKRWFDNIPNKWYRGNEFVMSVKRHKIHLFSRIMKEMKIFCLAKGYLSATNNVTQQES